MCGGKHPTGCERRCVMASFRTRWNKDAPSRFFSPFCGPGCLGVVSTGSFVFPSRARILEKGRRAVNVAVPKLAMSIGHVVIHKLERQRE